MKKNKESRTAKEVMAELEKDPEFVRRQSEKAERRRRLESNYAALEKPILEALAAQGFHGQSLDDVVNKYAPLPGQIVDVLLQNLASCEDRRQCEMLVRAVSTAQNQFDGRILTQCYDRISDDEGVRWIILATIAAKKPHSIDDWLRKAEQNPSLRKTLSELGYS